MRDADTFILLLVKVYKLVRSLRGRFGSKLKIFIPSEYSEFSDPNSALEDIFLEILHLCPEMYVKRF